MLMWRQRPEPALSEGEGAVRSAISAFPLRTLRLKASEFLNRMSRKEI